MAEPTPGTGGGWATDAALDDALGPWRCSCCGALVEGRRCPRCVDDPVCAVLGCGPEPLTEAAKAARRTR